MLNTPTWRPLLSRALRLERGAVVSFVGAGGKTTAMFRLAAELTANSWRVVTTTTTHLGGSQVSLAPSSLFSSELGLLSSRLGQFGHCLVTGLPDAAGKMRGIPTELVAELHTRPDVDAILVEADGSHLLPFKAPAAHEPVVPQATTHLVPVMGVDAIGWPLDDEHVHRPDRVAALTGSSLGDPVTVEIASKVLADVNGGAKQLPPGARLVPLINKVENDAALSNARRIAERLIESPSVNATVIGCMDSAAAVREVWQPIAGIVLAAGQSTRFGTAKQLMPWQGSTLVADAAATALAAGLKPVVVVTGLLAEQVAAAVSAIPVETIFNPDFADGQSTSVRRGLASLPDRCSGAVFLLADQPGVPPDIIQALIQAHRETLAPVVVPFFEERRGNPVLFDCTVFAELSSLTGDTGGRVLFETYESSIVRVAVRDPAVLQDIDTPEAYTRAADRQKQPRITRIDTDAGDSNP